MYIEITFCVSFIAELKKKCSDFNQVLLKYLKVNRKNVVYLGAAFVDLEPVLDDLCLSRSTEVSGWEDPKGPGAHRPATV